MSGVPIQFSVKESSGYPIEILPEAGHDVTFVVMTGAGQNSWGDEGPAIVVDTVLDAEAESHLSPAVP